MSDTGKIIHVKFGPGGGKRSSHAYAVLPERELTTSGAFGKEPVANIYSLREASKLFGISAERLRYWERSEFIVRTGREGKRRYYTFLDLIGIRIAKGLLEKGVPLRQVRRSVDVLRESLPKVARPLNSLRIYADGRSLIVKDDNGVFEPATGQSVIDFGVGSLRDDVVRVLRRNDSLRERREAYQCYLEGCRLDQDNATIAQAEAAYRRAIEIDPSLANAWTNLGNVLLRGGDAANAERSYLQALKVDSESPEAHYNLGYLYYDRREYQEAWASFTRAVHYAPAFADAHFNLAAVLEALGRRQEARPHWEAYLRLDTDTRWADIARAHLE